MRSAAVALLAGAALLQGCATPKPTVYGPIGEGQPYGYRDRQNADGGHTILVILPSAMPMSEGRAWLERRARDLCPGGVEKTNIFRAQRNETSSISYGGAPSAATRLTLSSEVEGYVYCKAAPSGAAGG